MPPKLSKPKKGSTYTEENLIAAVAAVKHGKTYKFASELYGVPIMTISDMVNGKSMLKK